MTTATLPVPSPSLRERWEGTKKRYQRLRHHARTEWAPRVTYGSRASLRHLQENAYTMLGMASFDAAGFVHSVFTGLLVTGATFLVMELKTRGA